MTQGQRLLKFIREVWQNEERVSKKKIEQYTLGSLKPEGKILLELQKAGLSIDWLFAGIGGMLIEHRMSDKDLKARIDNEKGISKQISLN